MLKLQFLHDFEYYLKVEKGQKKITINKSIQRFRKPIRVAVSGGHLDKDPFIMYKPKSCNKEVVFLSPKELKRLEEYDFIQPRLKMVNKLISCQTEFNFGSLNDSVEAYLIKQGDEEQEIRRIMN